MQIVNLVFKTLTEDHFPGDDINKIAELNRSPQVSNGLRSPVPDSAAPFSIQTSKQHRSLVFFILYIGRNRFFETHSNGAIVRKAATPRKYMVLTFSESELKYTHNVRANYNDFGPKVEHNSENKRGMKHQNYPFVEIKGS